MSGRNETTNASEADTLADRFLRSAELCRARDLKQLLILSGLVKGISELIHALQKERGASSIYLGSNAAHFADRLIHRVAESHRLERRVRNRLVNLDKKLDQASCSARFYSRVAFASRALASLPHTREQVSALALTPKDAAKTFTGVIAILLAVGFEAADIAVDSETSRALVALVNFAQGKEYAGQERATVGAGLSRSHLDAEDLRHLRRLEAAQQRAFKIFSQFADRSHVSLFLQMNGSPEASEFNRVRANVLADRASRRPPVVSPDAWYEVATRRIDAMRSIEDAIAADLGRLCAAKLKRASAIDRANPNPTLPLAMLVTDIDPAVNQFGMTAGVELFGQNDGLPTPMRSILEVVDAQSRRIDVINSELDTARVALGERKLVERAKAILMRSRRLSEQDAYTLLRQTAMNQNKRVFDVAEAIISMAGIL